MSETRQSTPWMTSSCAWRSMKKVVRGRLCTAPRPNRSRMASWGVPLRPRKHQTSSCKTNLNSERCQRRQVLELCQLPSDRSPLRHPVSSYKTVGRTSLVYHGAPSSLLACKSTIEKNADSQPFYERLRWIFTNI